MEEREPAWFGINTDPTSVLWMKNLWGKVPAIDLIHLPGNESVEFDEDLHLLFASMFALH